MPCPVSFLIQRALYYGFQMKYQLFLSFYGKVAKVILVIGRHKTYCGPCRCITELSTTSKVYQSRIEVDIFFLMINWKFDFSPLIVFSQCNGEMVLLITCVNSGKISLCDMTKRRTPCLAVKSSVSNFTMTIALVQNKRMFMLINWGITTSLKLRGRCTNWGSES